jgi:hypothetical protein
VGLDDEPPVGSHTKQPSPRSTRQIGVSPIMAAIVIVTATLIGEAL